MTLIQIYAFTDPQQALQAAEMGADHIGLVAGDYGLVHAELSFQAAREIVEAVHRRARTVALTMATEVEEILRMAAVVRPDIVHISTDPEDVDLPALVRLRRALPPGTALMKAVPVTGEESMAMAEQFAAVCDWLLLDTKVPGMPGVGATGCTHDWNISRRIVEAVGVPVILAGGLTPENVGEAIRRVRPAGVDSNTGTNLPNDPVRKDMARVRAFVEAVRRADAQRGTG